MGSHRGQGRVIKRAVRDVKEALGWNYRPNQTETAHDRRGTGNLFMNLRQIAFYRSCSVDFRDTKPVHTEFVFFTV